MPLLFQWLVLTKRPIKKKAKSYNRYEIYELLFSAHISYGKGKHLNQTVFFEKIFQAPNLYLTLSVIPKKFNSHKLSFEQFVFVDTSRLFKLTPRTPK